MTPVPYGVINTSNGPVNPEENNAINNEAANETAQESSTQAIDATEQAVVEGGDPTDEGAN